MVSFAEASDGVRLADRIELHLNFAHDCQGNPIRPAPEDCPPYISVIGGSKLGDGRSRNPKPQPRCPAFEVDRNEPGRRQLVSVAVDEGSESFEERGGHEVEHRTMPDTSPVGETAQPSKPRPSRGRPIE